MVLRKLEVMTQDMNFLLQISKRNALSEALETPDDLNLPIKSEDELQDFHRKLGSDENFFQNVVCSLYI